MLPTCSARQRHALSHHSHLDGNWDYVNERGHVPAPRDSQDNHVKVATWNAATNHVDMPSLTEMVSAERKSRLK